MLSVIAMIHYFVEGSDELDFEELQQFEGIQKMYRFNESSWIQTGSISLFEEYEMYTQVGNFSRKNVEDDRCRWTSSCFAPRRYSPITRMAAYHFRWRSDLKFCYACTIFREHLINSLS